LVAQLRQEHQEVGHGNHTVSVQVGRAVSTAAGTLALAGVGIPGRPRATQAFLEVVTDSVAVVVRLTFTIADPHRVGHVAVTIAGLGQNLITTAGVDGAGAIAHSTGIEVAEARILGVTEAIPVRVAWAGAPAHPNGVLIEAGAALFGGVGIEVARQWVYTTEDLVHIADAVSVDIRGAISTADAEGVELIAIAVTVPIGDARASAVEDVARAVADAANVEGAHAGVDVVAEAISVCIGRAGPTADPDGVLVQAGAVVIGG